MREATCADLVHGGASNPIIFIESRHSASLSRAFQSRHKIYDFTFKNVIVKQSSRMENPSPNVGRRRAKEKYILSGILRANIIASM
jgi:hypothetical protein